MLTQRDIARDVGVSVSTVSLVLNGRDEGRVQPRSGTRPATSAASCVLRLSAVGHGVVVLRSLPAG
jgi:transcriptional regulator with XRE-family HTH domain